MADNLIESGSEDEQSDIEVVIDHETECIEAILVQLHRPDLQPTRENIRLIARGVTELNLSFEDIHVLSDCINELQDLEVLGLDDNQLSELPDLNLPNLKKIVLNDNKFTSYPSALKQHNKIEVIYLYNNKITELPDDLNLPNLKVIVLVNNKLTSYPSALKQHNKIEEIWLRNNQITELPADTFENNLNLKELGLGSNPLGHVPSCLMHCTGLTWLALYKCKLTSVPEWFGKKLKNLDKLHLQCNPDLVELPNSIRFVKQAIINGNNKWREDHPDPDDMKLLEDCNRVDAMVDAACDRVWESQRILLTARPGPQAPSEDEDEDEVKVTPCHEVLFGGDEERQKSIMKLIVQYLI